jgi:multicomponent Na+:H+ antiporter subunit C
VLARQDEIQDDVEDRRVAETPSFDAEDDAEVPAETSEFPLVMLGSDGSGISDRPTGSAHLTASEAISEEKPGSAHVIPGPDGGIK